MLTTSQRKSIQRLIWRIVLAGIAANVVMLLFAIYSKHPGTVYSALTLPWVMLAVFGARKAYLQGITDARSN